MMDIRALHNEADYEWALKEVERYFENHCRRGPLRRAAALLKEYEDRHHEIPDADPVDVLHYAINEMGHTQVELADLIGRSRASEILNRKRALTLEMIRTISHAWGLPIETLTGPYELVRGSTPRPIPLI